MKVALAVLLHLCIGEAFVLPGSPRGDFSAKKGLSVAAVNGDTAIVNGSKLNIELTNCERARTVTSVCTSGTLCTVSNKEGIEGAPFGSYVDYILDNNGYPVMLMNEKSMHTLNIAAAQQSSNSKLVSLFTQSQLGSKSQSAQDVSRCSVTGTMEKLDKDDAEWDSIRMKYSLTHTYADQVMDSPRFAFYRLNPSKIFYVGGFGVVAEWVPVQDYLEANPDILASEARGIITKLNSEHQEDLLLTANHLLDVENVENIKVTSIDRLGFDLRVTSRISIRKVSTDEFRIGFRIPVISIEDAKSEVLKVFQEAWEKGEGYEYDAIDGTGEVELPGSTIPIQKIAEDGLS